MPLCCGWTSDFSLFHFVINVAWTKILINSFLFWCWVVSWLYLHCRNFEIFNFNYVSVYIPVWSCSHECRCLEARGIRSLGPGVTDGCKPPDKGAGSSRREVHPLKHWAFSPALDFSYMKKQNNVNSMSEVVWQGLSHEGILWHIIGRKVRALLVGLWKMLVVVGFSFTLVPHWNSKM